MQPTAPHHTSQHIPRFRRLRREYGGRKHEATKLRRLTKRCVSIASGIARRKRFLPQSHSDTETFTEDGQSAIKCATISSQFPMTNYKFPISNYQFPFTIYHSPISPPSPPSVSVKSSVPLWLCGKKRIPLPMPRSIETHLFVRLRSFVASCFLPPYSPRKSAQSVDSLPPRVSTTPLTSLPASPASGPPS